MQRSAKKDRVVIGESNRTELPYPTNKPMHAHLNSAAKSEQHPPKAEAPDALLLMSGPSDKVVIGDEQPLRIPEVGATA